MATHDNTEHVSDAPDEAVGWESKLQYFLNSDFVRSAPYWGIPFVLMSIAVYGGIGYNFAISFTDYEGLGTPDYSALDLEMYAQALSSDAFIAAAQNNLVLLVGFTTICLVLGLFLAILLDHGIRFSEKFQTVYLLPMSLSFVVTAQLWLWMFNVESGILNLVVTTLGFNPVDWLGNPSIALGAVIFALIWQFSGYTMVVYLAGLQSIPDDQFEAARVDGATHHSDLPPHHRPATERGVRQRGRRADGVRAEGLHLPVRSRRPLPPAERDGHPGDAHGAPRVQVR